MPAGGIGRPAGTGTSLSGDPGRMVFPLSGKAGNNMATSIHIFIYIDEIRPMQNP